jgi:hypothetical protein
VLALAQTAFASTPARPLSTGGGQPAAVAGASGGSSFGSNVDARILRRT